MRPEQSEIPCVTEDDGPEVLSVSYDPPYGLIDSSGGLLLVPFLPRQALNASKEGLEGLLTSIFGTSI